MTYTKIAVACDHAGYAYKERLKDFLAQKYGAQLIDFGAYSTDSIDYPDVAHKLAESVVSGASEIGIILCGSGNGVCITVNKHVGVRGALCWDVEVARLARLHNDANVLCMPARFVTYELAEEMVTAFIETAFEGGRHLNRVNKI